MKTVKTNVVPLDSRHQCNRCVHRDFARLEAVAMSDSARHVCGLDWQATKVCAYKLETGAVYSCNQFRTKRGVA